MRVISSDILSDQRALIPMMSKMLKELRGIMSQEFARHDIDLTKEQAIILRILKVEDGQPQNNLALVTSRDKTSLTRLLTTMEKKGLVTRKTDNRDKRVNRVFISLKGKSELQRAEPIMLELLDKGTASITKADIERTKEIIFTIHQNLIAINE